MKTLLLFLAVLCSAAAGRLEVDDGLIPLDRDGKPLNLDFEAGTLKDWIADGEAFEKQPIKGDTVAARRSDMKSGHKGGYWIGTHEIAGDAPRGTLTSVPFKVTQPFASFWVAGGGHAGTRVEVVSASDQKVIFKTSGYNGENLRPVRVNLKAYIDSDIFIRLIDQESGGWGHINFDHFRFHATRPPFPNAINPPGAPVADEMPPIDTVRFAGLSPEEAAKAMSLPPGFRAISFAGEPDVQQPIAFCIDHRGRLWVAEAYTYPLRAKEGEGRDRILVFEDTDGDGRFNRRTVFMEGLNLVSGIEVGFGGVWVGAAPYLMFIPIEDGDEPKPAGQPKILLDGWGWQDTHETLNTFTWGPDGWLYGVHGVFTHSNVGKPGAPDSERARINAGVWRYHPTKHIFEVFAEGTSNPWGIDFDEHGQCWIEACVIPHLFHIIQGARYHRQAGSHFNPHIYDDIKTVADHVHWAGNKGPHAGNARSAAVGGGHAHAGLMVYLGDSWPEKYRGQLLIGNIHGASINMDTPVRKGSGFTAHHNPDFIQFNDKWSQALNFLHDQNGSVYIIDWYDKNECHSGDPKHHDRSNGRIFKIVYGDTKWTPVDLEKKSDEELIELAINRGDWSGRHARRILQERAAHGEAINRKVFDRTPAEPPGHNPLKKLRWLWTMHVTGGFNLVEYGLRRANDFVRAWTIQLACEDKNVPGESLKEFARLAREDKSPVVRLYLASAMQRLPVEDRWEVIEALYAHSEDASDHNLPLMVWYAAEPLPTKDFERALALAEKAKLPNILNFTVRRTAALNTPEAFAAITKSLLRVVEQDLGGTSHASRSGQRTLDILNGLSLALRGQRTAPMPKDWEEVEKKLSASPNAEIRALVQSLSLTFGSAEALASLRKTLLDGKADAAARRTALESLLAAKDPGLAPLLRNVLSDANLQGPALRGLAAYDDPETPGAILAIYTSLSDAHKRDALNTLASRVRFANPLLEAVTRGAVPKQDLTAELVRQLLGLKNTDLAQEIEKVWGKMRQSPEEKQKEIQKFKQIYRAGGSQPGDAVRGRVVYARVCAQCHMLFDSGGHVGPDLTGSNRGDLEYILQNIIDPNAVIPNDYRTWNLDTKDDRFISGILKQQGGKSVTLVTANETIVVPRDEIASLRESELSMMPEGLLVSLSDQEVRDLVYYLRQPAQAPLIATPDTIALFFNGTNLSNWDGNTELWKVENGEIVGRSETGLKRNEFLKSQLVVGDFRLVCKVKLVPNKQNSGIQFRSDALPDGGVKGYQADIGAGWWGKLYEEHGRRLLWEKPGEAHVKPDDWNTYEIIAVGSRIRTAINGQLCVDLDDPDGARQGIIALQMHSGGPMEIRFKDLQLELNPRFELVTAQK